VLSNVEASRNERGRMARPLAGIIEK